MNVTEKDAREKACIISLRNGAPPWKCLGSECMAWRWSESRYQVRPYAQIKAENPRAETEGEAGPRPEGKGWEFFKVAVPKGRFIFGLSDVEYLAGWRESDEHYAARRLGFCGEVGK